MEAAEGSGESIEEDGIFRHRPHDIRQKAKFLLHPLKRGLGLLRRRLDGVNSERIGFHNTVTVWPRARRLNYLRGNK